MKNSKSLNKTITKCNMEKNHIGFFNPKFLFIVFVESILSLIEYHNIKIHQKTIHFRNLEEIRLRLLRYNQFFFK